MTKINARSGGLKTHEGGKASTISPYLALRRSVMACMLFEKEFYEDGVEISERIANLIPLIHDSHALANLAIYAREKGNLRHAPLLIVREMARCSAHKHLVAKTLSRIITRPDQITDFLALYWSTNGKSKKRTLSHQVKKGLAHAFHKFNEYQFAKYDRETQVKLRDALFLSHSKPKDVHKGALRWTKAERKLVPPQKFSAALAPHVNTISLIEFDGKNLDLKKEFTQNEYLYKKIVDRTLKTPDTWEVQLSAGADKKEVFMRLMAERKLGTLAFLRNLRNMKEAKVTPQLIYNYGVSCKVDKILPFQFIAAAKAVPDLEPMLEEMFFRCVKDLPKLKGKITLLIDVSGSMMDKLSSKSDLRRLDAASALAILIRSLTEETPNIYIFNDRCTKIPSRYGFALRDAIGKSTGGTNLGNAISKINIYAQHGDLFAVYETLIVITDEQSNDGITNVLPGTKGYIMNIASARNGVGYGQYTHIDGFSSAAVEYLIEYQKGELACQE